MGIHNHVGESAVHGSWCSTSCLIAGSFQNEREPLLEEGVGTAPASIVFCLLLSVVQKLRCFVELQMRNDKPSPSPISPRFKLQG